MINGIRLSYLGICLVALFAISGCDSTEVAGEEIVQEEILDEHGHSPDVHNAIAITDEQLESDWCKEHAVPESVCTRCNPSLIESFKESGDWCAGHDLPESNCRLCNPEIIFPQEELLRVRTLEQAESEISVSLFFRTNASICATDGALIQFASVSTSERSGITVQTARAATYETTITAPAEIVFDEAAAVFITSSVKTLVSRWLVSPGDIISEGDVLAILQSPDIAQLKSTLVSKNAAYEVQRKELERHLVLRARELISEADFDLQAALTEQARAELAGVRGLLLSAGLRNEDVAEVIEFGSLNNSFALRAPAAGVMVERKAQLGELMEAGQSFAVLADPTLMWIEAQLTEEQIRAVEIGQNLVFNSDGRGLHRVGGKIIWISRFLDPHSRMGTVRAKVIDPNNRLQAGEFGRVEITASSDISVTLVPKDAVQWEGCCNVVFVKETIDRYRPRKVQLLSSRGPYYQVSDGLMQGEEVVVEGAFLLKTELKKSSIGAGCCGIEPVG